MKTAPHFTLTRVLNNTSPVDSNISTVLAFSRPESPIPEHFYLTEELRFFPTGGRRPFLLAAGHRDQQPQGSQEIDADVSRGQDFQPRFGEFRRALCRRAGDDGQVHARRGDPPLLAGGDP